MPWDPRHSGNAIAATDPGSSTANPGRAKGPRNPSRDPPQKLLRRSSCDKVSGRPQARSGIVLNDDSKSICEAQGVVKEAGARRSAVESREILELRAVSADPCPGAHGNLGGLGNLEDRVLRGPGSGRHFDAIPAFDPTDTKRRVSPTGSRPVWRPGGRPGPEASRARPNPCFGRRIDG